jgi:hypothetical protein
MRRADTVLALALLLGFGVAILDVTGYRWQVALGPALAAGIGALLAATQAVRTRMAPRSPEDARPLYGRSDLAPLAWFLGAVAGVLLLGFTIGGGLYAFLHVLANGGGTRRLLRAALAGAVAVLLFALVFETILGVRLYRGVLLPG